MPAAVTRATAALSARCILAVAVLAGLGGCARPDWTDPEKSKGSRAVPAPVVRKAVPRLDTPAPPWPKWVAPLLGKPIRAVYPREAVCIGNTDGIGWMYAGQPSRVVLLGWSWDAVAKAPAPRIVLTDSSGLIVGGGRTGVTRPDVIAAKPGVVTTAVTGWQALSPVLTGGVSAFGVVEGGRAVCPLGGLAF